MLRLLAGNPSPWTGATGNNTYLLDGEPATLIDAGIGEPSHLAALDEALAGRPLAAVIVTHGHSDHVGGLPALLDRWPSLRVRNAGGDACVDGEVLAAGRTLLRALHTPGHAPDHFCFFDEAAGDIYCGDLARLGGSIVIPASKGGHLGQYLRSLQRIRDLAPRRLLPGHGPIVDDPRGLLDRYLAHRHEREGQVIEALAAGNRTPETIALRIYGELPALFARAAADGVLAHLVKLQDDGRAAQDGEGWRLV